MSRVALDLARLCRVPEPNRTVRGPVIGISQFPRLSAKEGQREWRLPSEEILAKTGGEDAAMDRT